MYGLWNSELSTGTCLFQFSHKMRQTMLSCTLILLPKSTLNANLTTTNRFFTNDDWQHGRFENFESDHRYKSNHVRFEIESNHEALQVPKYNYHFYHIPTSIQPSVFSMRSILRLSTLSCYFCGGTEAAAPPLFRPGNPALCGSCPLVTPYYCKLGDLLCYNCMLYLSYHFVCMHVYFVFSLFAGLFSFVDFPSVLWYCWLGLLTCKNRLPYNLYCVGGDVTVKHCTIQSNPAISTINQQRSLSRLQLSNQHRY